MEENLAEIRAEEEKKEKRKRPRTYRDGVITGVFSTILFFVIVVGIGTALILRAYPVRPWTKNTDAVSTSKDIELDTNKISKKINQIEKYINTSFLYDKDTQSVEDGIYKGMLSGLDDDYAMYYTEEEYSDELESASGEYAGIGALLQENLETNEKTVLQVFDDSPAKESGLQVGDILLKADDADLTKMDLDTAVSQYIRGEAGTSFDLTVLRGEEEIVLHLTRRVVQSQTVTYQMTEGKTGVIVISQFEMATEPQFKKAVDKLIEDGAKGLIIDLRDNPGGMVDACVNMVDYLIEDDLITYTADKNGNGEKYTGHDGHSIDLPMVLLVNENSASCSEIFTGALMDYDKATVVGTKTFGKGIIQDVYSLGDGTGIKFTVMNYYTPKGNNINGEGFTPDIEIGSGEVRTYEYLSDDDPVYKKGLEILGE